MASPSLSSWLLDITGSDFDGRASGLMRSWSRITITRSGRPARAGSARSMPSMIRAPNAQAIFKRRVIRLDRGLQHIVLMTDRRHGEPVEMQVGRHRRHRAALARIGALLRSA